MSFASELFHRNPNLRSISQLQTTAYRLCKCEKLNNFKVVTVVRELKKMSLLHPIIRTGCSFSALCRRSEQVLYCTAPSISHLAFSTSASTKQKKSYQVVIAGAGAGGSAMASKLSRRLGRGKVAVIEPHDMHYYQPFWTLVGGGIKRQVDSGKSVKEILPKQCEWIKDSVKEFQPENNVVITANGDEVQYEYLVVAMGLTLHYEWVDGLVDALERDPAVCSNYSYHYVGKTFPAIQNFQGGNAIFTFPNTPIKCAGAPQKIMYLAEDYFRKHGMRDKANIMFNSSLGVIFAVKKYAKSLLQIVEKRNINVNYQHNLVEVRADTREAVFEKLNTENKERVTFPYSMLHVCPPMSSPDVLKQSLLCDAAGYLDVVKETGQHKNYKNIFGIGDCTNIPTSKTAAAVAGQCGVLDKSIKAVMKGQEPVKKYDGYTSCPLITGYGKLILAEFDFNGEPLETFPLINQANESRTMYHLKQDVMPVMYWKGLVKGHWNGPGFYRKAMHLGLSK